MNAYIDTGRLIDEVRCRRCLWDASDELYKNKDAKNKAWEEIEEALFGDNFRNIKDLDKTIRQRWKSARDGYFKTKANLRNTPSGSGAKKITKYIFYDELTFLDHTSENEVSESLNISDAQSQLTDTTAASSSSQSSHSPQPSQQNIEINEDRPLWARKRKNTRRSEDSQFEKEMLHLLNRNVPDISADDMAFFSSLGPVLKTLNQYQKLVFRSKVLKIAMDLSASSVPEHVSSQGMSPDVDSFNNN